MSGTQSMTLAGAGRRLELPSTFENASTEIRHLKEQITQLFSLLNVSRLISSAAAGSDLLLISEAMSRGAYCEILLPFEAERFRVESVVDRGSAWGAIFDAALAYERSQVSIEPAAPGDPFIATNVAIINRLVSSHSTKIAVAIWDKRVRSTTDYTAHFIQQANLNNIEVFELLIDTESQ